MTGSLVLVATPIGNLGDLSSRAVEVLTDADAIACEDTRHTRKLLSAAGILGKRLLAVHQHNEAAAADGIVALLARGDTVALVTDAGTPAISDPGARVVVAVVAAGFEVTCVPGPAALIVALAVSGLPTERFVFEGFLPRSGKERTQRLAEIAAERRTVVLYEAPNRVLRTLTDLAGSAGSTRRCSISRELTKRFEETWRGTVGDAVVRTQNIEPRGEYVIVLEGQVSVPTAADDNTVRQLLDAARASGLRTRDAVDEVSRSTGRVRREVYAIATTPVNRSQLTDHGTDLAAL